MGLCGEERGVRVKQQYRECVTHRNRGLISAQVTFKCMYHMVYKQEGVTKCRLVGDNIIIDHNRAELDQSNQGCM